MKSVIIGANKKQAQNLCGSCVSKRNTQLLHRFCACFLFAPNVSNFILFPAPLWLYLSGTYFIFSLGSILFTQWPLQNIFFVHRRPKMLPSFEMHHIYARTHPATTPQHLL